MIYLQIIITLFTVFILLKLFRQKQQSKISLTAFSTWLLLWLFVLVVFWQPNTATYLANLLGIGRGSDLVVYFSIIIIFYLLFKIFVRLNKLDSDLTKLVRQDTLKDHEQKK
ncbi:MAG: hypothetical protein C3F02_04830 [Parcubacteria group bacterium]|nr:MAG: hypothetical protein C3F02_04830 [Parcubacteria group bacterium]